MQLPPPRLTDAAKIVNPTPPVASQLKPAPENTTVCLPTARFGTLNDITAPPVVSTNAAPTRRPTTRPSTPTARNT